MAGAEHSDPSSAPQRAMLAMVRSRRAWLYVLSIAALVVPAAGIAYLGAVSYRDERGAVSAQNERQRQAALAIASQISHSVEDALDAAERDVAAGTRSPPATRSSLQRYWFWIDADQRLRIPRPARGARWRGRGCLAGRQRRDVHDPAGPGAPLAPGPVPTPNRQHLAI
jgi:hypothetical protein